jgi:hypothetical protein
MYENNFASWDFYMINYLISFKDIRRRLDNMSTEVKSVRATNPEKRCKDSPKYYNEEDMCFSFILTLADRTNMLYKITPSKLYVNIPNMNIDKWCEFNLRQMRIINTFSEDVKEIEEYFKKVLFLNKRKQISLDLEKIEKTNPILFKCMLTSKGVGGINWITSFM